MPTLLSIQTNFYESTPAIRPILKIRQGRVLFSAFLEATAKSARR